MVGQLKVLISAYACEPGGGEPGVGWNWVKQIGRVHKVWVITRSNNKKAIENHPERPLMKNVQFIYVDLPTWIQRLKKLGGIFTLYLYYYLWQLRIYFVARALYQAIKFDVAHHVTFVGDWLPSFISLLDIPFIWGPVGGSTHRLPRNFFKRYTFRERFYELCRRFFQTCGRRLDPFVMLTRRRAWKIITYTNEAKFGLPISVHEKTITIDHIGIEPETLKKLGIEKGYRIKAIQQFIVYTTGRLVYWKGYDLLLEAFALFVNQHKNAKLLIGGKGPMEPRLRYLVRRLGLSEYVHFLGYLPYDQVLEQMAKADIFCLPTLRDGPPVVLLEAMAVGTPVVCLDLYGAKELVPDGAGIKIRVDEPQQVINQIAEVLLKLANDPTLRSRLSKNAIKYTSMRSWNRIGDHILQLYENLNKRFVDSNDEYAEMAI